MQVLAECGNYWRVIDEYPHYKIWRNGAVTELDGRAVPILYDDAGWPFVEIWRKCDGYPSFETVYLDRLIAEAWVHNPEGRGFVSHVDGDRFNNNADNLEWCYMLPRKCPIGDCTWTVYESVADCVAENFISPNDLILDLHSGNTKRGYFYVNPTKYRKDETIEEIDRSDYYRQTKARKYEV